MPRSNKKKEIPRKVDGDTHLRTFRRTIHSVAIARAGLSKARRLVPAASYARIVAELGRMPVYKNLFAPTTFPKDWAHFAMRPRLEELKVDEELVWSACVLALFQNELAKFISKKAHFDLVYAHGSPEATLKVLDEIEEQFGYSLWFIGHKLQVLQLHAGLKAQKDYARRRR